VKLAYLSQGRLFLLDKGQPPKPIESQYGREVVERSLSRQNKNKWKSEGEGALFSRGSLWGVSKEDPSAIRVSITAVSSGKNSDQVFYALDTSTVGGLFSYELESGNENRLFHRENLHIKDLCQSFEHDLLACSQHLTNGTANIGICRKSDVDLVTEGDSVDEAPAWVPGSRKELVFQSAGVARSAGGYPVGLGPFSIQRLDLETGALTTLKEDENFDFLSPRMDKEGRLFFIRRPFEKPGATGYPPQKILLDALLFPFRLLRAIFHYLNFFSLIYSKKPLTTASGPKVEGPDQKTLLLRGKIIDAEKVMREGIQEEGVKSLVPASWQLLKREPGGEETLVAKAVLAFDLDSEGQILYSNGNAIYRAKENGSPELLLKANLIETIVALR
jgi:hypothetical protein